MTILKILTTESYDKKLRPPILRDDAVPVVGFDDKLRTIIDDLIETMKQDVICIGLAAPQVGIGLQIAIVCMDRDFANAKIIINPTNVIELGKKDTKRESCMSLPNKGGNVERYKKLSVDVMTVEGKKTKLQFDGFEIDHLNGIMYSDKIKGELEPLDFDSIRKKLKG